MVGPTGAFGAGTLVVQGGAVLNVASGGLITGTPSVVDNGTIIDSSPTNTFTSLTGTGVLQLNGTAVQISSGGYTGIVTGTGSLLLYGASAYNFGSASGGVSTYSGGTTFEPGVNINAVSNNAFGVGTLIFDSGGFQASGSQFTIAAGNPFPNAFTFGVIPKMVISGSLPIDITGNGTLAAGVNTITISPTTILSGVIADGPAGPGSILSNGKGTLVLAGNNTYTGGTNVASGTLVLAGGPYGGATYVAPGATLLLNSSSGLGTSTTSSVNIASGGTMIVNDNSGYAGLAGGVAGGAPIPTTVAGVGIVGADTYGALRGADGQPVQYGGNIVVAPGGASVSGGISGTLTLSGVISNSPAATTPQLDTVVFSRANSSTTVLTGASTYTGETEMIPNPNINVFGQSVSVLQIGANNAINPASGFNQVNITANYDGLTLDLHGFNQSFAYVTGGFHVNLGGALSNYLITNNGNAPSVLTINNGNATVAGTGYMATPGPQTYADVIQDGSDTIALVKSGPGTEILTGANAYSGGTTVAGGTLQASSPSALGTSGQGTITMAGGTLFLAASQTNVAVPIVTGFKGFTTNEGGSGANRSGPSVSTAASGTTPAYGVATLTTRGTYNDINSVFSPLKTISTAIGFTASFTYTDTSPATAGLGSSGGVAFVIQSASPTAVGTGTNADASSGIANSFTVELNDGTSDTT
jgi:autotransporter-associated beta strand protein